MDTFLDSSRLQHPRDQLLLCDLVDLGIIRWAADPRVPSLAIFLRFRRSRYTSEFQQRAFSNSCLALLTARSVSPLLWVVLGAARDVLELPLVCEQLEHVAGELSPVVGLQADG